jgi:cytochrome c-type biogenesis protein
MNAPYAVALTAGMAATVNPCGFAMLPAYLSAFIGSDHPAGRLSATTRAVVVTSVVTAGFVATVGAFGLIVTPFALQLDRHLPWLTIVIGVALAGLGIALLTGRNLRIRLPTLERGGAGGTSASMFLFGVSYAVASLSCTVGPFLAVTTSTFRTDNWLAGLGVFVAYGLGMGVVIGVLTVAATLAKAGVSRGFRRLVPAINRLAGGLMIIAGTYVAYYGWYEIRAQRGDTDDPVIDRAVEIQRRLQDAVVPDRPVRSVVVALIALAAVAIGGAALQRHRRNASVRGGPEAADRQG